MQTALFQHFFDSNLRKPFYRHFFTNYICFYNLTDRTKKSIGLFCFSACAYFKVQPFIISVKESEDQNEKMYDLNSVKEVARCLLYTDVHKVENYPFLVKHPFTDSAFAAIAKNPEKVTENKVINILETESKAPLKAARRC